MPRLREYLDSHVDEAVNAMGEEPVCIVHGDYRFGNVIWHPTEPKIVAVLDWEICTIGNPAADLAYLNNYSYGASGTENAAGVEGVPSEAEFTELYYKYVDRPQITESFYNFLKAFIEFRRAAIGHGVFSRALAGNASSTKGLTFADGPVSPWVAMCTSGLKLVGLTPSAGQWGGAKL